MYQTLNHQGDRLAGLGRNGGGTSCDVKGGGDVWLWGMQLAVFAAGTYEVTDYVISWTFPDLEGLHDTRPAPVLIVSVDDTSAPEAHSEKACVPASAPAPAPEAHSGDGVRASGTTGASEPPLLLDIAS